ncbi:hypothetical protein BGY98DRAFT_1094578 [Russula aff. rugulosa BPL654]|nr:hypothetical protein BGY98DRAFT_1094578 [Russula aff. rugulosa BPL654]
MVDYNDPSTVARDFAALVSIWHVVDGIFIWEFFTTLDFEWDVIRGRRPWRWTIWIYSLTRVATLVTLILNMIGFSTTVPINCQLWATLEVVLPSTVFGSASLLIMFRIFAIWNREKIVVIIAMCVWMADVGFLVYGSVMLRSTWSPEKGVCVLLNAETSKPNIISSLVTDVALLLIMLVGLFRLRREGTAFGAGRILWNQGLIWLSLATVAEVPSTVLMCLYLNSPLSYIFQAPSMVTMSIAATRMYRSLVDFSSSDIAYESKIIKKSKHTVLTRIRYGPIPLSQVRSKEIDQCPTSTSLPWSESSDVVKSELPTRIPTREIE